MRNIITSPFFSNLHIALRFQKAFSIKQDFVKVILLLIMSAFLLLHFAYANPQSFNAAKTPIPELTAGVMDHANILSRQEIERLDEKIMQLEYDSGSQIAVLIIPELNQEDIAF